MKLPAHGSNPGYLYAGMSMEKPEQLIDFSVNVNPLGPPDVLRQKWESWFSLIQDYPDPYGNRLRKLIAEKEKVEENQLIFGNGAAEVIQLVALLLRKKRILIVQPAFSEYEQACQAHGCQIDYYLLPEGNWTFSHKEAYRHASQADAVFLCTPNNPTGVAFPEQEVLDFLQETKGKCLVIIDEAFYDFAKDQSFSRYLRQFPHLIVLRSLTKMYAIAGLRAGYAMADASIIQRLEAFKPHWNVNALALVAAEESIKADSFIEQTRTYIARERKKMFEFCHLQGFQVSMSSVNFYLLKDSRLEDQRLLLEFLLKKGIVLRHTYNFPGLEGRWLRVAVKTAEENAKLREALMQWKRER